MDCGQKKFCYMLCFHQNWLCFELEITQEVYCGFVYYFAVYITIYETCKEVACLIGLYDDIWGYLFFSTVFYDNQKCYMSDSD